jgi:hypothetical protein
MESFFFFGKKHQTKERQQERRILQPQQGQWHWQWWYQQKLVKRELSRNESEKWKQTIWIINTAFLTCMIEMSLQNSRSLLCSQCIQPCWPPFLWDSLCIHHLSHCSSYTQSQEYNLWNQIRELCEMVSIVRWEKKNIKITLWQAVKPSLKLLFMQPLQDSGHSQHGSESKCCCCDMPCSWQQPGLIGTQDPEMQDMQTSHCSHIVLFTLNSTQTVFWRKSEPINKKRKYVKNDVWNIMKYEIHSYCVDKFVCIYFLSMLHLDQK